MLQSSTPDRERIAVPRRGTHAAQRLADTVRSEKGAVSFARTKVETLSSVRNKRRRIPHQVVTAPISISGHRLTGTGF
eukprot:1009330-Prymnesium_polylepis.1